MAPVAPAPDQTSGLLQKLPLDSPSTTEDAVEPAKQLPAGQNGSSNGEAPSVSISSGSSLTPVLPEYVDHNNYYVAPGYVPQPFYYGGYDPVVNEWGDYSCYANHDGAQGVYREFYQGYGYPPYTAYSSNGSATPTGHDGELYGQQQYQYPSPFFKPHTPTGTTKGEASTSNASDQPSIPVASSKKNANGASNVNANGNDGTGTIMSNHQNSSSTSGTAQSKGGMRSGYHSTGYQDPRFAYEGMWSHHAWFDRSLYPGGQHKPARTRPLSSSSAHNSNNSASKNQIQPIPHIMGMHAQRPTSGTAPALTSRMYPASHLYSGSGIRNGFAYGYWGMPMDGKYKARVQGNGFCCFGNESQDGLTEMNRGPRAGRSKNSKAAGSTAMIPVNNQNLFSLVGNEHSKVPLDREQYNREDFSDKYSDAKFFIIKSYSEDDIHKSIKYNVWASTPNGNKKLDAGYREAHQKAGGCTVFLFYSVNASGQFVGVAEMIGPVDFSKTVDYWQQDKWIGCFPVKWHIIKDVPNNILKHITLENNDNKPVTNSRDTQEVKLEQGLQMLKIFKEHGYKTSVLDDFDFYENRQNAMQERRAKQKLQKQAWDGKAYHPAVDSKQKNTSGEVAAVPGDALKVIAGADAFYCDASRVNANGVKNCVANSS